MRRIDIIRSYFRPRWEKLPSVLKSTYVGQESDQTINRPEGCADKVLIGLFLNRRQVLKSDNLSM